MESSTTTPNKDKRQPNSNQELLAYRELLMNMATSRTQLIKSLLDPRRDIDDECGYLKTESLTPEVFRELYNREPIAARVVEVLPRESWKVQPEVFETEDSEETTAFENDWEEVSSSLRGKSKYKGNQGNPVWEYLSRADELSGIGRYGVILLGIDDGKDLSEPAEFYKEGSSKARRKLTFVRAFDESLAKITKYEMDTKSERFGQPTEYDVTFNDPKKAMADASGQSLTNLRVHWTRVVHIADNLESSEILGKSRMQIPYNRLFDLRKLYAGSAEMYWRGAFPGLSLETTPQLGGDVEVDHAALREQMEKYMTGLQRYLSLMGMQAKSLAPQVVDPTAQIDAQLQCICILIGVPKRVFMGSELGELASSQDADSWIDRLVYRQNNYLTPRVIVPFVDRLVDLGILSSPQEYAVKWPDMKALTKEEVATVATRNTEALAKYVQGGVESIIQPMDYLTRIIGLENTEAEAILDATMERLEEEEDEGRLGRGQGEEDKQEETEDGELKDEEQEEDEEDET